MQRIRSILAKLERMATLSFENAVRLHEDAILLFEEDRIPSALHTSALSIEELGKYFLIEEIIFQSIGRSESTEDQIQHCMRQSYHHIAKQKWFARLANDFFVSKPLVRMLQKGKLEEIKQKATYVGFPRKGKNLDFHKRVIAPFRTSKKRAEDFITAVNDYLIILAVETRKGVCGLDITKIDDRLAEERFEKHFCDLWPIMRPSTKLHLDKLRQYDDEER